LRSIRRDSPIRPIEQRIAPRDQITRLRARAIVHDHWAKHALVSTIVRHDERIGRAAHRIADAVRVVRRDGPADRRTR
jgi:hypothetical protein